MIEKLSDLGDLIKQFREARGLNQDQLAQAVGANRTLVAHLEQGRRIPRPEMMRAIATHLGIPDATWAPFARAESHQRQEFEASLSELVGRVVGLRSMDIESVASCEATIGLLFSKTLTASQACDTLNSALVFYAVPRMSQAFFRRYFSGAAFQTLELFQKGVERFQSEAIRLFSTFGEAYRQMNVATKMDDLLAPLQKRSLDAYNDRTVWEGVGRIRPLPEDKLDFLGYISVAKYKSQKQRRETLARYLRELATDIRRDGAGAVDQLSEKRKRKIDSLLKEFSSTLMHTPLSGLFTPNAAELEAEASRILRDEKDETEMEAAQSQALSNLSQYLSADYIDVYVATSMRTRTDFIAVNRFVEKLFGHEQIAPLRLRYFNPTQSWIEDRVAKGLVEALMLKRAQVTLYMAQKADSFGKDSEASVALGQGKPVIVYVPKLFLERANLDSEQLILEPDNKLREILLASGSNTEDLDELDHDGLFSAALAARLRALTDDDILEIVAQQWADLALLDEAERIRGKDEVSLREKYTLLVQDVAAGRRPAFTPQLRFELEKILQAVAFTFEVRRARVFKEVHPLALQIILSTGVLNGILVSRSVNSCAALMKGLLENSLALELVPDDFNYKLIEKTTGSTIRVIARNALLSSALDATYRRGEN
ncbi:MAG TPA: helix-turn-helix transcriptional regulator [Kofleriaceae bacterium]|nr:helix-turn-helix transcriptional regulator [Kofleriaceae bacterium]